MDQNSSFLHSLEVALPNLPPLSHSSAYIYRVPREFRQGNESHYTPTTVFIGPFHAVSPSLNGADCRFLKYRALNHLLNRSQTSLQSLFKLLKGLKNNARLCYGETVDFNSDEFAEMLLLDGCFILALLISDYHLPTDRASGLLIQNIQRDLLVFENQLPLFVLENLYKYFSEWYGMSFVKYFLNFLKPILPTPIIHLEESTTAPPRNLLELVLLTLFPRRPTPPTSIFFSFKKINISELTRYGIIPVPRERNLADIRFSTNGLLEIPPLYIQDSTTTLFKNLLALEMSSGAQSKSCFLSYLSFMDELVDTDMDVKRLVEGGVWITKLNDCQALVSLLSDLNCFQYEFP